MKRVIINKTVLNGLIIRIPDGISVFFCKEKWHFVLFFAVKWVSEKAIGHEQIVVAKFV